MKQLHLLDIQKQTAILASSSSPLPMHIIHMQGLLGVTTGIGTKRLGDAIYTQNRRNQSGLQIGLSLSIKWSAGVDGSSAQH